MMRVDIMVEADVRAAIRKLEDLIGEVMIYIEETTEGIFFVIEYSSGTKARKQIESRTDLFKVMEDVEKEYKKSKKTYQDAEVMTGLRYHLAYGYYIDVLVSTDDENAEVMLGRDKFEERTLIETLTTASGKDTMYVLTHLRDYKKAFEQFLEKDELMLFTNDSYVVVRGSMRKAV